MKSFSEIQAQAQQIIHDGQLLNLHDFRVYYDPTEQHFQEHLNGLMLLVKLKGQDNFADNYAVFLQQKLQIPVTIIVESTLGPLDSKIRDQRYLASLNDSEALSALFDAHDLADVNIQGLEETTPERATTDIINLIADLLKNPPTTSLPSPPAAEGSSSLPSAST